MKPNEAFTLASLAQALRAGGPRLLREVEEAAHIEFLRWAERNARRRFPSASFDANVAHVHRVIYATNLQRVFRRETEPLVREIVREHCMALPSWVIPRDGGPIRKVDDGLTPAARQRVAQINECIAAIAESLGLQAHPADTTEPDSRQPTAAGPAVR